VFTEPQFDDRIARAFGASASIRVAELDPLGARLEPGAALYPALMRALTASLVGCLGD
jgi:zinc transport system substrate-binding protein